jgi:hypothetical protein
MIVNGEFPLFIANEIADHLSSIRIRETERCEFIMAQDV